LKIAEHVRFGEIIANANSFAALTWGTVTGILVAVVLALFIAIGFMAGPATVALGVGRFGVDFGWGFPITVVLAHVAYGALFGFFDKKWLRDESGFFHQIRLLFFPGR
jgi:hypothetical protein